MHDPILIDGEQLKPPHEEALAAAPTSDAEIDERYVSGEVRIVLEQARYPLKQIPDVVQSADYNLQPDFQRRPRWSREKQSRLIESLILNVPIPPVFLYEQEFSRYEVMDGRQRLTAISQFYGNEFQLQGLKLWPELNDRKYADLPEQVRRGIDRRFLSAIVLLHETAKSADQADRLKQLVFERINTGGEDLSPQEKRNALFPGAMNSLCIKLSRHPALCRMWGIPEPEEGEISKAPNWNPPQDLLDNEAYKTMEDAELVLRFFAHRQRQKFWRGGTRLDEYLDQYLKAANAMPPSTLSALEETFKNTADFAYSVLGESAFWLWRSRRGVDALIQRATYIAYDPIMYGFSRFLEHRDKILARKSEVKDKLQGFYIAHYEDFDGRKTNPVDIRRRDEAFLNFLKEFTQEA
ncbi:DUF262 domain-containing protein [Roseateles sp. BYS87W]|uniref:DUF262 domain-containing protein n=1 Tax=Pelomonas baiyunensis TaxID=3299026 RepID=A0ABW7H3Q2_9BURK